MPLRRFEDLLKLRVATCFRTTTIKVFLTIISVVSLLTEVAYAQSMSKDFQFVFKFGHRSKTNDWTEFYSAKNKLIFHGVDTTLIYKIKLTKEERKVIYHEIQEINFNKFSERYIYQQADSAQVLVMSPHENYFLSITEIIEQKKWNGTMRLFTPLQMRNWKS